MSEVVKIISPVDGSVYAERPVASDAEIAAAITAARAALPEWRKVPVAERARYMLAFLDALLAMNDDIAVELAWQMGRPVRYGGEKGGVEERVRAMVALAEEALKPYYPPAKDGFRRYIAREPVGVVMVIAPWNYPYLTAINTIVPGLLAGNAIILKHAAQTLLVGERFAEAFGAPACPRACSTISSCRMSRPRSSSARARSTTSTSPARSPAGAPSSAPPPAPSPRSGLSSAARIRPMCAPTPSSIMRSRIWSTARSTIPANAAAASSASMSTRRSMTISSRASPISPGNMWSAIRSTPATTLGPMARALLRRHGARARSPRRCAKAPRRSINMKVDGDRPGSPYLAPEVLTNVNHQMEVMREESFGPVVGIMKVRDDDEAITLMNDSPYGLTASIWTRDMDRAAEIGAGSRPARST